MADITNKTLEGLPEESRSRKMETSDPRSHYVELDALRGIAILGVVLSHIAGGWLTSTGVYPTIFGPLDTVDVYRVGNYGVPLFFLLSGYLLTWTEEKRARAGTYSVRSYALRRVFRLVPAYYVMIVLIILFGSVPVSVTDVVWHASFFQTLNPYTAITLEPVYWSLTPEAVFYCILPFVVLKFRRLWHRLALLVGLYLIATIGQIYMSTHGPLQGPIQHGEPLPFFQYLLYAPTNHLWLFLAGVLVRMLIEYTSLRSRPLLRPGLVSLVALVSFVIITGYVLGVETGWLVLPGLGLQLFASFVVDAATVALFIAALLGGWGMRRVLNWRPLAFVGMISYSMFLLHMPLIRFFSAHFMNGTRGWAGFRDGLTVWGTFSAYTVGILLVVGLISYFSYRFIESPFLRYKPK